MEPDRERIERIMQRMGTTEEESRVVYHLSEARELLYDLNERSGLQLDGTALYQCFDRLTFMVGQLVLIRDYPGGWTKPRIDDEEDEDVQPPA